MDFQTIFNWFCLIFISVMATIIVGFLLFMLVGMLDQLLCGVFKEIGIGYRKIKLRRKDGHG